MYSPAEAATPRADRRGQERERGVKERMDGGREKKSQHVHRERSWRHESAHVSPQAISQSQSNTGKFYRPPLLPPPGVHGRLLGHFSCARNVL